MASVHPSRAHLVPNEQPSSRRSPSPPRRRRSPSRDRRDSRARSTSRERAHDRRRDDYDRRERRRSRSPRRNESSRRSRSPPLRSRDDRDASHRRSPEYSEYRRSPPRQDGNKEDGPGNAPWRQPENMYAGRGARQQQGNNGYDGGYGGGADFMESRRLQREASTIVVWPPSPKAPSRGLSPSREKSKKKSKRRRDDSVSSTSSSEDDRRRRKDKDRKRSRKDKERERSRDRSSKHRSKRSRSRDHHRRTRDDSDRTDSEDERRQKERSRRSKSARSATRTPPGSSTADEDDWVEKPGTSSLPVAVAHQGMPPPPVPASSNNAAGASNQYSDDDSDDEVGPQPLPAASGGGKKSRVDERQYGGALLRGEGSAMAAFLQSEEGTEGRIPRRGEIGLTSDEIEKYETAGYVMSGSRHRRMNAVRIRKENQVISAEEKRGILKLQKEERERREAILREEFSQLVEDRLKGERKK